MLREMLMIGLPDYTVRTSPRAKYLRLKITVREGLVVVIPNGFDRRRIPTILAKRRPWLEKHFERIRAHQKITMVGGKDILPEVIDLTAVGERWGVEYHETLEPHVGAYERKQYRLLIRGNVEDRAACKAALRRWLARKARHHFEPWIDRLSECAELPFSRLLVKGQKTRWASCSRHRTVSINYKLIFLPSEFVRYVFIHELCHTRVMNHSRRYWETLQQVEPNYKQLHEKIRKAWRHVPTWATA